MAAGAKRGAGARRAGAGAARAKRPAAAQAKRGAARRARAGAAREQRPTAARGAATPRRAGLDRLWSPWRMAYIRKADEPAGCLFCRVAAGRADARDLVLARTRHALLMLNRYPYNPGHLMIAVTRHAAQFRDLGAAERAELLELTALAERALESAYAPHGLNYGLNVGRVAGAGFPGHLHLHLVPRWNGDTNFMPVVAETRVLPESLPHTWRRLRDAIAALAPRRTAGAERRAGERRAPGAAPRPRPKERRAADRRASPMARRGR